MREQEQQGGERPTLHMIVGLPGAGKTTLAKELESQHSALRLNADEWVVALFGNEVERHYRDEIHNKVEALQWQVAKRALVLGCSVILDYGFWAKEERDKFRREAIAMGAQVKMIYLDVEFNERWARVQQREESKKGTLHIKKEELEDWTKRFEPPTEDELA